MKFAYDIASWPLSNTNCHRLGEELEGCVNLEDMFRVLYDYIKTTILLCQIYTMYLPIPCCYTMYLPIPCYVYHVVIPCICLYHVLYTRYSMYLIKYYCQLSVEKIPDKKWNFRYEKKFPVSFYNVFTRFWTFSRRNKIWLTWIDFTQLTQLPICHE